MPYAYGEADSSKGCRNGYREEQVKRDDEEACFVVPVSSCNGSSSKEVKKFMQRQGHISYRGLKVSSNNNVNINCSLCFVEADLDFLQKNSTDLLPSCELSTVEKFPFQKRKHSYLLGRYTAKQALVHNDNSIFANEIYIKFGVFKQSVVYPVAKNGIQVSISHCDQRAIALAFPETHPMGIDLELNCSRFNAEIEAQLTSSEKKLLKNLVFKNHYIIFWTMKEALSKVLRTGFVSPLEINEIEKFQMQEDYSISDFKYFPKFLGCSFIIESFICSLVYPKYLKFISKLAVEKCKTFCCQRSATSNPHKEQ